MREKMFPSYYVNFSFFFFLSHPRCYDRSSYHHHEPLSPFSLSLSLSVLFLLFDTSTCLTAFITTFHARLVWLIFAPLLGPLFFFLPLPLSLSLYELKAIVGKQSRIGHEKATERDSMSREWWQVRFFYCVCIFTILKYSSLLEKKKSESLK